MPMTVSWKPLKKDEGHFLLHIEGQSSQSVGMVLETSGSAAQESSKSICAGGGTCERKVPETAMEVAAVAWSTRRRGSKVPRLIVNARL